LKQFDVLVKFIIQFFDVVARDYFESKEGGGIH